MEIESSQQENRDQLAEAKKANRLLVLVVFFFLLVNGAIFYKVLQKPEPTYQGKTVTQWLATAGGREPAPEVINAFGSKAWPYLIKAIRKKDSVLKKFWLDFWSKRSPTFRGKFLRFLPIPADTLRFNARLWIMQLGADAKEAVPELIRLARHAKDLEIRSAAINLLGFAGLESPDALSALMEVLKEPEIVVMGTLILDDTTSFAVARFGARAKSAVPLLMESIRDRKNGKPHNEISALGLIGPEASEAVPMLVERLRDSSLQGNVVNALSGIGSGAVEAVPSLVRVLKESSNQTWPPILETLMKVGPPAKSALPALKEIESQQTNVLRVLAAMAIARIENDTEHAVSVLSEVLQQKRARSEPTWTVKVPSSRSPFPSLFGFGPHEAAAWFLGELGPPAKGTLPALAKITKEGNGWSRTLAARAIWRISQDQAATLPILTEALTQKDELTFHVALTTFEEMGTKARAAATSLADFVADKKKRWSERREALKVLRQIDPETAAKVSLR